MIMGASWLLHEYTAVNKITFEGEAAEEVWPNMLFQLVWIVWFSRWNTGNGWQLSIALQLTLQRTCIRTEPHALLTFLKASWAKSTTVPGSQSSLTFTGSRMSALCSRRSLSWNSCHWTKSSRGIIWMPYQWQLFCIQEVSPWVDTSWMQDSCIISYAASL